MAKLYFIYNLIFVCVCDKTKNSNKLSFLAMILFGLIRVIMPVLIIKLLNYIKIKYHFLMFNKDEKIIFIFMYISLMNKCLFDIMILIKLKFEILTIMILKNNRREKNEK